MAPNRVVGSRVSTTTHALDSSPPAQIIQRLDPETPAERAVEAQIVSTEEVSIDVPVPAATPVPAPLPLAVPVPSPVPIAESILLADQEAVVDALPVEENATGASNEYTSFEAAPASDADRDAKLQRARAVGRMSSVRRLDTKANVDQVKIDIRDDEPGAALNQQEAAPSSADAAVAPMAPPAPIPVPASQEWGDSVEGGALSAAPGESDASQEGENIAVTYVYMSKAA